MNSFSTVDVIAACHEFSPQLKVVSSLDSFKVMLAIAAVESGGADPKFAGHDCGPRFEPVYYVNGYWYNKSPKVQEAVAKFDRHGASSFGPWQMMFFNFSPTRTPDELLTNLESCAQDFVAWFNGYVSHQRPISLDEIGEIWNAGHKTSDIPYTTKLTKAYNLI